MTHRFGNPMRRFLSAALTLALGGASVAHADQTHADCSHAHENEDRPELRGKAQRRKHHRKPGFVPGPRDLHVQILGFNDFHGQLSAGRFVGGRPVGSAAVLAAHLFQEAAAFDGHTFIVHAGDHVGASPPASALLQDEPSIAFLNLLGNAHCSTEHPNHPGCNVIGTLGNHEFDEGVDEMLRLIEGGNHPEGPFLQAPYRGAAFPYVCANVVDEESGEPILPPYVIRRVEGVPIAFVGAVLKDTPTIVTPTGVAGVRFLDEAAAINAQVAQLKARGVETIIVQIHQGGSQAFYAGETDASESGPTGAIAAIVGQLDSAVDVVVSGHAHSFTNALMPNAAGQPILVTQAFSGGTAYGDIELTIDRRSRDVVERSAAILTTYADDENITPDPEVAELVASAEAAVEPFVSVVIGDAASDITRTQTAAGESALGNLIADAQRAAMGTDIAFMNPGGIRTDILAGQVTWGDLFAVQPFGNSLVRMDLTGAQLYAVLEQQWLGQASPRIMQASGLGYTWDAAAPDGSKIVEAHLADGTPIDPAAVYTVTVNSFMAAGGDNFTVFTAGTNQLGGPIDLDALIDHIQSLAQPFTSVIEGRIQQL